MYLISGVDYMSSAKFMAACSIQLHICCMKFAVFTAGKVYIVIFLGCDAR